ncbi:mandelate racemase/muconate lactonizing enzyme family protein [Polynucleobacter sp. HIN11]|uniref:mandelate racemase/muconate lactonizing enzyme family protein n=2 Tax=unclassified Polynucleobacter TaxID=2640945 RepID=UPI002573693C|nr:enolase C-terminal domain-like protein [Polynucleobacter sp. HIN11]
MPMKIAHARIYPLSIPLSDPIKMSGETVFDAKTVVLQLVDEKGYSGWGEASVAPLMTGETLDSLLANLRYLVQKVRGISWEDPRNLTAELNKVLYGNSSAKSCLQMALLDIYTQKENVVLWKFLRTLFKKNDLDKPLPIPILRMLGGSIEKEQMDAESLRRQGYRHWKIKVGLLPLEQDIKRVETLLNLLGEDTVSVDANGAMNIEDAIRFTQSDKVGRLAFAEQLITSNSSTFDFCRLKNESKIAIGLDESIHGLREVEQFIELKAFDGASLKLIKTGGLIEAMECALMLENNNLKINLACKVAETSISAAATAAIGFALGRLPWGYSMSNQYLSFDVCKVPLVAENGLLDSSKLNAPGIGIDPDIMLLKSAIAKEYSVISC